MSTVDIQFKPLYQVMHDAGHSLGCADRYCTRVLFCACSSPTQSRPLGARVKPARQLHTKELPLLIQNSAQSCVPSAHWLAAEETESYRT